MQCPYCQAVDTRVVDSRIRDDRVRRRRVCAVCDARFNTVEITELKLPTVVKADGSREPFSTKKLRAGMDRALQKRPVATEDLDHAVTEIENALRALDEAEVDSRLIGDQVMGHLRQLDQVAYVRYASVYRSFEDLDSFRELVEQLQRDNPDLNSRQLSLLEDRLVGKS